MKLRRTTPKPAPCGETMTDGCLGMGWACCDACSVPLPAAATPAAPLTVEQREASTNLRVKVGSATDSDDAARYRGSSSRAFASPSELKSEVVYGGVEAGVEGGGGFS